uniref:Phospholipid-transporting ATPase n=1 Tax=Latimeria chalumnae TaxID=7897 RepID=H3BD35_LATCH
WEVKANDSSFHRHFKKKAFLFFKKRKYASNKIKTAKYSVLTFIPLNLYEQFHRLANVYFLLLFILQCVPAIATLPWFTTLFPLMAVLGIRGIKDLVEDVARHKSDTEVNNRPCDILKGQSFIGMKWEDIQVGDVIRLKNNELVPADLLLLHSSEPNSLCYVETTDIDGETNLKYRQALGVTHQELGTEEKLAVFDGKVICEEPNCRLHSFIGTLLWQGEKYALDQEKVLLRGCKTRNTANCYGLVIFAGFDTKIMRNSGRHVLKRTKIDRLMNHMVLMIFGLLFGSSLFLAIGAGIWEARWGSKAYYLSSNNRDVSPAFHGFLTFWGYIIVMSRVVPVALFVTFELVHLVHSFFINWDVKMYYPKKDIFAKARTTTMNEELGQIKYIFSDKTGTLTQNIMTFKKCCISGKIYAGETQPTNCFKLSKLRGKAVDLSWNKMSDESLKIFDKNLVEVARSGKEPCVQEFFRLLALCHTVMIEDKDGQLVYQAASPDEEALVTAARNLGYVFVSRTQDTITICELGEEQTYKLLAVLDFSSVRKRMSVLLRNPEGKILLYTKGADTVIFERLQQDCPHRASTEKALDSFAEETLRTLCLAYKEVEENFYLEWRRQHHEASVILHNREHQLEAVYEEIEKNLELLGATAIEDKLQDGVPETLQTLRNGNIKIWVLTGDKLETAVNIGYSCKLLTEDMDLLDGNDVCRMLRAMGEKNNNLTTSQTVWGNENPHGMPPRKKALIITGHYLNEIMKESVGVQTRKAQHKKSRRRNNQTGAENGVPRDDEAHAREKAFVDLACSCQTVICCRVTPKQKASVVQLIKNYENAITLAIGDGANDVNMIKTAHIGIGISGQEGTQAVQSSDYALAQFCFLQRLLLVHGRWSYIRISKFLRFFFFKTLIFALVHIWYSFFNGFSAQSVLENWFITLYTVSYTAYPILAMGLLEQDVSDKKSIHFPELYKAGQNEDLFNVKVFGLTIFHSITVSLVLFFVPYGAFTVTVAPDGTFPSDYQCFAVTIATATLFTAILEVMMEITFWTVPSMLAVLISILFYFLFSFITHNMALHRVDPTMFLFPDASLISFRQPYVWLTVLLTVGISVIPGLTFRVLRSIFTTSYIEGISVNKTIHELRKVEESTVELQTYFKRESSRRRSSYAFSHRRGFGELITSGTSLRQKKNGNYPSSQTQVLEQIFLEDR